MKEIIIACILFLISGGVFVMSILSFMQKGFLLNNAYIYASKEERKQLDKKPHYRQSAIVFLFLGVAFLLLGIMMLTKAYWLFYIAIGVAILTIIYAVVSGIKIENQEDKKKSK